MLVIAPPCDDITTSLTACSKTATAPSKCFETPVYQVLTFQSLMVLSLVDRIMRLWLGWFTQRTLLIFSSISKDFR